MTVISRDTSIEVLVEKIPASVSYLMKEGIRCIACGEPIWGTLEEAARDKGFDDDTIDRFVRELNELALSPREEKQDPSVRVKKLKDL
ncbi:MAG TPA: DUF1858 domain-containing protein [Bacteroidetes bacterium]|nr:DUF1858 domain-containing protein [Bacteroidota bacterium]